MSLTFLQTKLLSYPLSQINHKSNDPFFCLLPFFYPLKKLISLQKAHPSIIWIAPHQPHFLKKRLLFNLHSIYFIKRDKEGFFFLYDERYLKTQRALYRLPPVKIDPSLFFLKNKEIEEQESLFFFPKRNYPIYFKGDSLDRLSNHLYLKALQSRQEMPKEDSLSSIYLFLKKTLDK